MNLTLAVHCCDTCFNAESDRNGPDLHDICGHGAGDFDDFRLPRSLFFFFVLGGFWRYTGDEIYWGYIGDRGYNICKYKYCIYIYRVYILGLYWGYLFILRAFKEALKGSCH